MTESSKKRRRERSFIGLREAIIKAARGSMTGSCPV